MKNNGNTAKKSLIRIIAAVLIGILLLIAVLCFFVISDRNADIKPGRIGRIGKHIYYPEDTFFSEKRTEEQNEYIKSYLESIDKMLDEDVYATYYMYYPTQERVEVSANAYVDGVILSYFPYTASTDNDEGFFQKLSRMVRPEIDTSGRLNPKKLIPDVKAYALQNKDDMYMDQGDTIYGTYLLKYDMEDERLYYEFTLNRWSYVNVDAKTGEIIGWNFDNGVVY